MIAPNEKTRELIHFATMHRAKRQSFDGVLVIAPETYFGDPETTGQQRKLMYVALTRAKRYAGLVRMG